jgi:hypothetical protein
VLVAVALLVEVHLEELEALEVEVPHLVAPLQRAELSTLEVEVALVVPTTFLVLVVPV